MGDHQQQLWREDALAWYGQGGRLIDPAAIPHLAFDAAGLHGDAEAFKAAGRQVHATGTDIDKRWGHRLPRTTRRRSWPSCAPAPAGW